MISLGVDFVVHSVRRYKEEVEEGHLPKQGLKIGLAGILAALLLAMASDSIAFLSNLSSNIEAVIHFGSAAAIAVFSSFWILGIVAPIAVMRVDELIRDSGKQFAGATPDVARIVGSVAVASAFGGVVIVMLAVDVLYGVFAFFIAAIIFIAIPLTYMAMSKTDPKLSEQTVFTKQYFGPKGKGLVWCVEKVVTLSTSNARTVLMLTALFTGVSVFFALKLEPTFDVKDFFDPRSDMVIGLDKVDEHVGEKGGEPGIAYIKGDLMNPNAVSAISDFI